MLGVGLVCVFHAKVVDAKDEGYLAIDVSKYPRSLFAWHITRGLEVLFESVVGNTTGLLEAVHAYSNFH